MAITNSKGNRVVAANKPKATAINKITTGSKNVTTKSNLNITKTSTSNKTGTSNKNYTTNNKLTSPSNTAINRPSTTTVVTPTFKGNTNVNTNLAGIDYLTKNNVSFLEYTKLTGKEVNGKFIPNVLIYDFNLPSDAKNRSKTVTNDNSNKKYSAIDKPSGGGILGGYTGQQVREQAGLSTSTKSSKGTFGKFGSNTKGLATNNTSATKAKLQKDTLDEKKITNSFAKTGSTTISNNNNIVSFVKSVSDNTSTCNKYGVEYYVVEDTVGNYLSVGPGIVLKYNSEYFKKYGIDTNSLKKGSTVSVNTINKITEDILADKKAYVQNILDKNNITDLTQNQIDALTSRAYSVGNISDFPSMYKKYGNTEELYKNYLSTVNGKGTIYEEKLTGRRNAEIELFKNGYTTDKELVGVRDPMADYYDRLKADNIDISDITDSSKEPATKKYSAIDKPSGGTFLGGYTGQQVLKQAGITAQNTNKEYSAIDKPSGGTFLGGYTGQQVLKQAGITVQNTNKEYSAIDKPSGGTFLGGYTGQQVLKQAGITAQNTDKADLGNATLDEKKFEESFSKDSMAEYLDKLKPDNIDTTYNANAALANATLDEKKFNENFSLAESSQTTLKEDLEIKLPTNYTSYKDITGRDSLTNFTRKDVDKMASVIFREAGGNFVHGSDKEWFAFLTCGAVVLNNAYDKGEGSSFSDKLTSLSNLRVYGGLKKYINKDFETMAKASGASDALIADLRKASEIVLSGQYTLPSNMHIQAENEIATSSGTIWTVLEVDYNFNSDEEKDPNIYIGYDGAYDDDGERILESTDLYGNEVSSSVDKYMGQALAFKEVASKSNK